MLTMAAMSRGVAQAGAANSGRDPRLKPAAHEFEACLMKEFLEPLQHDALFGDDKGDGSGEGSGSALMSFGSEALARAISERGGFGIAEKIIRDVEKQAPPAGASGSESSLRNGRNGGLKF